MMMIGSLSTYMKNLKMQAQFDIKQRNGDLQSHKTLEEWLGEASSSTSAYETERGDKQLKAIRQKLDAGAKLTQEERRYLQAKDPEAYAKLEATEREQKAFEQKLRQCRTKEEAQRLKMTYLNSSLMVVKAVEHNPNIGTAKKLEIMMQEKRRCDKLEESAREFVREGGYAKLPTEAEEAKARKDAEEAKRPVQDAQRPEPAQKPQSPEKTEDEDGEREEKKAIHVESREERKVKRARAQARASTKPAVNFALASASYQAVQKEVPEQAVDVKA